MCERVYACMFRMGGMFAVHTFYNVWLWFIFCFFLCVKNAIDLINVMSRKLISDNFWGILYYKIHFETGSFVVEELCVGALK